MSNASRGVVAHFADEATRARIDQVHDGFHGALEERRELVEGFEPFGRIGRSGGVAVFGALGERVAFLDQGEDHLADHGWGGHGLTEF